MCKPLQPYCQRSINILKYCNCPGTLGDVNPLRNKGLRFPPRRKLASKRVQNTTLGAIAQKNTSIYQWVGVPGQLLKKIYSGDFSQRLLRIFYWLAKNHTA